MGLEAEPEQVIQDSSNAARHAAGGERGMETARSPY